MTSTPSPRTADEIEAAVEAAIDGKPAPPPPAEPEREPLRFMNKTEVAHYLGLVGLYSLTDAKLPPPDVIVGDRQGWSKETIDAWNAARPGSGRWGPRSKTA